MEKKIKVCFVVSTFPRNENDPAVPWLRKNVLELQKKGINVKVLAPSFKGLKDHEIEGIPVKRFRYFFKKYEDLTHDEGMPTKIKKFRGKLAFFSYFFAGRRALRKFHKKEKFDIIHVHWPFPHALWCLYPKLAKLVVEYYAAEVLLIKKKFKSLRFTTYPTLKKINKNADVVMTFSNYVKNIIQPFSKKSVKIIPFGSGLKEKKFKKKQNKIKRILFVGRIIERKGIPYLIKSLPEILKKEKTEIRLVGKGDKKEFKKIILLIERLGLRGYVKILGEISSKQLGEEYKKADVFVLPSIIDSKGDTEGLGVVLIEALSYGIPIIGSNVGGIPDIIIAGKTGLLVEQKNEKDLAKAILKILKNKKLTKKLVLQGKKHIKENFSWDKITKKYIEMYKSLVNEKRRK